MTKQLNKKGTSLVELIAVIVIMGIIAGIAVPVTIAVINRQKKNASAKSCEAIVSAIKQATNEVVGEANGADVTIKLVFENKANKPKTVSVTSGTGDGQQKFTEYADADFLVENLACTGTIEAIYTIDSAEYEFKVTTLSVNGYNITAISAAGKATVGTKAA